MDTSMHTLANLFAQLGLDNDEASIEQFVQQHQLADHVHLADAPFWNRGQASFLAESLKEDADWAEVIDELNALLH